MVLRLPCWPPPSSRTVTSGVDGGATCARQCLKVTSNPVALTLLGASDLILVRSCRCCLSRWQHSLTFSIAHSLSTKAVVFVAWGLGGAVDQVGRLTLLLIRRELGLQLHVSALPVSLLRQSHSGLTLVGWCHGGLPHTCVPNVRF